MGVIVDIAIDSVKEIASQKNIMLFSNVPEGTIIDADEALILSVITNLISNAVKYGKESGHIFVSAFANGENAD